LQETPSGDAHNAFVVKLLADLQRGRYAPRAWWYFLADSWRKSWQTAQEHPALARSWARATICMLLLGLALWGVLWRAEGQQVALDVLPTLALCAIVQQSDVFVHLGLNRGPDGRLRERLGFPTMLTLARGALAGALVAHLLRGLAPPPALTLGLYLPGIATDLLDGQIARRTGWRTHLGGNLDGEADLFLYSSVTLCAWLAGRLPGWFVAAMLLRFALLIAGGLFSYFVALRQVDFSHTIWGRLAGFGQALCLIAALLPRASGLTPVMLPLLLVTLALGVLAPIKAIRQHLRLWQF
jgi:phosphatidylglycerophosphate synthase